MAVGLLDKVDALKHYLRELEKVAVAFSGGVDSTFLLKVAHDVLGDQAVAITATANFFPVRERSEAQMFCAAEDIRQFIFEVDENLIEGFCDNPPDRCYHCKKFLFRHMKQIAAENDLGCVVDGSNMDDANDYRPGAQAIAELDVKSPLRYAGLWKAEIRSLSKGFKLSTWDKPSFACLASRFVYGEKISAEKLSMVDRAERFLIKRGFRQVRVRIHDRLARIEVEPQDLDRLMAIRAELIERFQLLGFQYITLDLQGYRTGSMNEPILGGEAP